MEKESAKFKFTERFRHTHNNAEDEVYVYLEIDYRQNSYNITPKHGHKEFKFLNGRHSVSKWANLLICIQKANEFGSKELSENK